MIRAVLLALLLPAVALAGPAERAERLARKAEALLERDEEAAVRLAERALALHETPRALQVLVIARTDRLAAVADPAAVASFLARDDLSDDGAALLRTMIGDLLEQEASEVEALVARLEAMDPGSMLPGIVRTTLLQVRGRELLPVRDVTCPAGATAALERAEEALASGDLGGAEAGYGAALGACPEHATWWMWSGDVARRRDAPREALGRYRKALKLEPCHHVAHRFAADVLMGLPDRAMHEHDAMFLHALDAVACNPQYEAGWSTLRVLYNATGAEVVRVDLRGADPASWDVLLRAAARADGPDALARRAAAAEAILDAGAEGPLWTALGEARRAGLLEEAVLFETLDAELAVAYRARRVDHLPGLRTWIYEHHVVRPPR